MSLHRLALDALNRKSIGRSSLANNSETNIQFIETSDHFRYYRAVFESHHSTSSASSLVPLSCPKRDLICEGNHIGKMSPGMETGPGFLRCCSLLLKV